MIARFGNRWSVVTPVRESELSARERQRARQNLDIRIP
jgi:hypothetical protein